MNNIVEIKDLQKIFQSKYQKVEALQNINLSIKEGDFLALSGQSGSGKTTLFNIIAGLEVPTKGEVFINNTNIFLLKENKRTEFRLNNIGFIFQNHQLLPVLNAWENIAFLLTLKGIKSKEAKKISLEWLEKVDLKDSIYKKPSEMSGGQQQRVAVARALAGKPNIILADEPTASLDLENKNNLLSLLKKINEEEKATFLVATHDELVKNYMHKIIYLKYGKIIE